jgi:hypothetical protein
MKKILIPFLGLFVLILATPFILAKIMNSNIDERIVKFQKEGYQIKEVKKEVGYLSTKREFLVSLNDRLKKIYGIDDVKADVILSFKNLPVTTANFELKTNNLKFYLKTKDLKHFTIIDSKNHILKTDKMDIKFLNKLIHGEIKSK